MQRKQDITCFAGLCNKNNSFSDRSVQVCLVYKIRTFIFHFYWNNRLTCWLCYIFPLVLASRCLLILWFWNDRPGGGNRALIMLQTNLNCSESSGLLAPVACELPPSPFYLGANTFFFYFRSLHFNATRALREPRCTRALALLGSLKTQQRGKEETKATLILIHFWHRISQVRPPQSPCTDVGFRSALVLNSTSEGRRVLTVLKRRIYYREGWRRRERGISPKHILIILIIRPPEWQKWAVIGACDTFNLCCR